MKLLQLKKILSTIFFYALLSIINSASAATICYTDAVPDGWVIVGSQTNYSSCGNTPSTTSRIYYNEMLIEQLVQLPQDSMQICANQKIPNGWVMTSTTTMYGQCNGATTINGSSNSTTNNIWKIVNMSAQTGMLKICSGQQIPAGWQVYQVITDRTSCLPVNSSGNSAANNVIVIQQVVTPPQTNLSCTLQTRTPVVQSRATYDFSLQLSSNVSGPVYIYLNGTKNGQVDAVNAYEPQSQNLNPTVPWNNVSFFYTNGQGNEGSYTRNFTLKNAQNQTLCTTNTVSIQLLPDAPTCSLSANASYIPIGQSVVFTINGTKLPASATAYWYGSKNGVLDVNGGLAGSVPNAFSYPNVGGATGTYSRFALIRYGTETCITNTVNVAFQ